MSRTLFLYVFKDLLRIFLLTTGALAGIMSFGGLLRPLTEHGLDAAQVGKVLTYFMPAMMTYSLPIAALFATTVVYGRLAADNEVTACRAAGISYLSIAIPAFVLGITVAIISLLFLCFIVPNFTLKVERVIYSNLARLIANEIETTRQIRHEGQTIYAQGAVALPPDPKNPREQVVTLSGVMIVSYDKDKTLAGGRFPVPGEFYLARNATVLIHRGGREDDEYSVEVVLDDGITFPRERAGKVQAGVRTTRFGPVPIPSPIDEDTKFMDIRRLHELLQDPTRSQHVRAALTRMIRDDQVAQYLQDLLAALNGAKHVRFDAGREQFELARGKDKPTLHRGVLTVPHATWTEEKSGTVASVADVEHVAVTARATPEGRMAVVVELHGAVIRSGENVIGQRRSMQRSFNVEMPPAVRAIADRTVRTYLADSTAGDGLRGNRATLYREMLRLGNTIYSEMHSRASFAISCLILVLVGAALGVMFKSGNFLTAFAISVVPALLCIALIVTGANVSNNIPWRDLQNFQNPLATGVVLIWSGNVVVLVMAVVLMGRLQRQ